MKERPILFSGAMVRALLAGTKTQTRRIAKEFVGRDDLDAILRRFPNQNGCPYGQPGDRLWVREPHWWFKDEPDHEIGYFPPKLTIDDVEYRADGEDGRKVWRPSIHMPRWASRITLEVTSVRVERLQDISAADCIAEGISTTLREHDAECDLRTSYQRLWEQINGPGSWAANPWVWAIDFRRLP